MIHICFSLYDKDGSYSQYLGTAICSLLENTYESLYIHVIYDESVCINNINNLFLLAKSYRQHISFYKVEQKEFIKYESLARHCTIGTLFRLKIPEMLPRDVDRVIYLDADIVVNLDIKHLWNTDLRGNMIAACHDADGKRLICNERLVNRDCYFNAGVLLFDINKIRQCFNLFDKCINFLTSHPDYGYADQDALNYIFKDSVLFIPKKFNFFTVLNRSAAQNGNYRVIWHFAGDKVSFGDLSSLCDRLFFHYWLKTPWGQSNVENSFVKLTHEKNYQAKIFQKAIIKLSDQSIKRIVFGAKSKFLNRFLGIICTRPNMDYFVDNNLNLIGSKICGLSVKDVTEIYNELDHSFFIFVLSGNHYNEIATQLKKHGLIENEDFIDARMILNQQH